MNTLLSKRRGAALLAAAAFGIGAVATGTPAYADEGDTIYCYQSVADLNVYAGSAPVTSVPYGTGLTVTWHAYPECGSYSLAMMGPGFSGLEGVGVIGSRGTIWATPPNGSHTFTWTLEIAGTDSVPHGIASITITVT